MSPAFDNPADQDICVAQRPIGRHDGGYGFVVSPGSIRSRHARVIECLHSLFHNEKPIAATTRLIISQAPKRMRPAQAPARSSQARDRTRAVLTPYHSSVSLGRLPRSLGFPRSAQSWSDRRQTRGIHAMRLDLITITCFLAFTAGTAGESPKNFDWPRVGNDAGGVHLSVLLRNINRQNVTRLEPI